MQIERRDELSSVLCFCEDIPGLALRALLLVTMNSVLHGETLTQRPTVR